MKTIRSIIEFFWKHLSTILSATVIIAIVALFFFFTFPFDVASFKKINVTNTVQVGNILEYTNEYCQNVGKGVPREITRFLVPKDKTLISPIELSGNPNDETLQDAGCRISDPIKLPIDSSVPAGEYKLLVKVKYYLFNVRKITVEAESQYFTIAEPDTTSLLLTINEKIDSLNKSNPDGVFVNTVIPYEPRPAIIPFTTPETQPAPQPTTPVVEDTPTQTCAVDVGIIKLLCREV